MQTPGIVYVVDDDAEVRQSWECVLAAADLPTKSFATAEEFLDGADCSRPCCLILDLRMPGMGGQRLLELLRQRQVTIPVIAISGHADVPAVIHTMKLGVDDFLTKPVDPAVLVERAREALRGTVQVRNRQEDELLVRRSLESLTTREREVLALLIRGKIHKQIARELGISTRTVDHHHAQINLKMQANSLADLMRMGFVMGML